jgi:protein-glutamine gamma-glutamyltransferase
MAVQIENGRHQQQLVQRAVPGSVNGQARRAAPAKRITHRAERLLQISLAALTALGTLLLGMGEHNITLPVLAIIVAVSSVYLTDVKGWLQLNTFVANVAGIIAGAITVRDWNVNAAEGHLLSLANLLIYLQFVLLYRKKNVRNYWLLLLLSLLQVAVAAALNMSLSFGVLLPAYMFVGLVTMALFVIHREQVEQDLVEARTPAAKTPGRWPLTSQRTLFQGRQPPAAIDRGLGWVFFRQMVWLGAATLVFAIAWFVGLPRPGKKGPWRPSGVVPYSSVGFSESVTLGQLGEVYENPEEVMRVSFRDEATDQPYRVGGDSALFRGTVLYEYRRRHWNPLHELNLRPPTALTAASKEAMSKDQQLVRENITIRARDDKVLFTVLPAYAVEGEGLAYSRSTGQLLRPEEQNADEPFSYSLVTTAFRDHIPQLSYPAEGPPREEALRMPAERDDGDPLAGLRAEAKDIAGDLAQGSPFQAARTLEGFLRDSGRYQYSLRPIHRTPGMDPIEDFVTVNRLGHCEYFASALTLMLRSLEIPARLAIGFKGGEYNHLGQYYQVRELHAHAWVEAYVPPSSLPPNLADNEQARTNGAWLILDATPYLSEDEAFADSFGIGALRRLLDLTQLVWTNYVLGMDSQRQREAIYQPLIGRLEDALRSLTDEEGRERIRHALADFFGRRMGLSHGLLSWQGMLALLAAWLLLVGLWKAVMLSARIMRRWFGRRRADGRRKMRRVEFYEQFESLLTRHGMPRPQNQTQREFALAAGGQLAESPTTRHVGPLPRRIVDVYYRVRFGQQELGHDEVQSIDQDIQALGEALAARAAGHKTNGRR